MVRLSTAREPNRAMRWSGSGGTIGTNGAGGASRAMIAVDERPRVAPPDERPGASGQLRSLRTGRRVMRWVGLLLAPVLVGYAFLDRGFAYIHIPGIPIFAGEVVVLVGLVAAVVATAYLRRGFE